MQRIAILVAVPQELGPISHLLSERLAAPTGLQCHRVIVGTRGQRSLLLAATGVGSRRSGRAAASVLQTWKPDLIVMAGVAGALSPELAVGELVTASAVVTERGSFRPHATLLPCPDSGSPQVRIGSLLSLDRVLTSAGEKRDVADRFLLDLPLAVEMETAGVVQAATLQHARWAAVRAISDTADESLPLDFNRLRGPDGDLPTSRVALAALAQPAAIPGLIRLARNTSRAAEVLARFLGAWLDELGPPAVPDR